MPMTGRATSQRDPGANPKKLRVLYLSWQKETCGCEKLRIGDETITTDYMVGPSRVLKTRREWQKMRS
jgi:hypothetical protein